MMFWEKYLSGPHYMSISQGSCNSWGRLVKEKQDLHETFTTLTRCSHRPYRIWAFVGIVILGCLQRACCELLAKPHNTILDVAVVEKHDWNCGIESWCSSMELARRNCPPRCRFGLVPVALVRAEILWPCCRKLERIDSVSRAI